MDSTVLVIAGGAGLVFVMICGALILKLRDLDILRRDLSLGLERSRTEMQSRLDVLQSQMTQNASSTSAAVQNQFRESARLISEVSARLVEVTKTNSQILDFSKQMQSLENILKNPKQRGVLGEYFLETLLGNVLQPNQYRMQYRFAGGEIVDAAVFYRDRIIPVDAKFSLENYNRMVSVPDAALRDAAERDFRIDVKKRIDETSKYIRPADGTTDFALMFVPAEGVYYNLLIYNGGSGVRIQDLVEYAFSKHVIIVSPTSFFAYLETVLMGLRAQSVEDGVREIVKRVHELDRHLRSFGDGMEKLGRSIGSSVTAYNGAMKEFGKIDKDIMRITDRDGNEGLPGYSIDSQTALKD